MPSLNELSPVSTPVQTPKSQSYKVLPRKSLLGNKKNKIIRFPSIDICLATDKVASSKQLSRVNPTSVSFVSQSTKDTLGSISEVSP